MLDLVEAAGELNLRISALALKMQRSLAAGVVMAIVELAIVVLATVVLIAATGHAVDLDTGLARVMRGRSGTAVIVSVASGRVLAAYRLEVAARRLARPGSAFKPFTLLALLQSGKLKPTDSLVCRRHLHVGSHDLSCSHPQSGALQATSALAYSCNDFFATFGLRLSAADLRGAFEHAGLSSPTHLASDEAVGFLRSAGSEEERQLQAIGEGDMRVTALAMLAAYRNLALRRTAGNLTDAERTVFDGLENATEYGMARLASVKNMQVAGKTGTARTDRGAWTNAWFCGYAPARQPEVAVVVFLEKGTGPSDAAVLGGQIFQAWRQSQKP